MGLGTDEGKLWRQAGAQQAAVGWQYVADLHGCATPNLDDIDWVRGIMLQAAMRAGASVIGHQFHHFEPHGISGVVVIAESHLAIHIWPERNYAAIDLFTCSSRLRSEHAVAWIAENFGARQTKIVNIERGPAPAAPDALDCLAFPAIPELARAEHAPRDDIHIGWDEEKGGHWFINERTVVSRRTRFQHAEILDLTHFGRALFLDGRLQSTERDEYIYHEALVQPAMCLHPCPRRVLILGGGEGATAREVLKHDTIEEATMVDIDRDLIGLANEHLDAWHHGCFSDPRLRLATCDGFDYIGRSDQTFDVVIVDLTDSFEGGLSEPLYTIEFISELKRRMAPGGILAMQAMECTADCWTDHVRLRSYLKKQFATIRSYTAYVPAFCATWGYVFAGDTIDPLAASSQRIDDIIAQRGLATRLRFYDGRTHQGLFALPKDLRGFLGEA